MNPDVLADIERRLKKLENTTVRYRAGEVTDTGPLAVALGGSPVSYEDVRSVDPVRTGEQVAALVFGSDLLVLGAIGDGVRPSGQVSNSATQAVGTGSLTALTFDQEGFDEGAVHSTSLNTGRLVAPTAGLYLLGANVTWASNATGYRYMALRVNGSTRVASDSRAAVSGDTTHQTCSTLWRFVAGDYFEVVVFQNSGGSLNVAANSATDPGAVAWITRLGG